MKIKRLQKHAIPTIWPSFPEYVSKPKPYSRPTKAATTEAREEKAALILQRVEKEENVRDSFSSLEELDTKISQMQFPVGLHVINKPDQRLFLHLLDE